MKKWIKRNHTPIPSENKKDIPPKEQTTRTNNKLEEKEKQSLLNSGKIKALAEDRDRSREIMKDIEKLKNPMAQLKNANIKL